MATAGQLIDDVDGDMVADVMNIHAGDPFAAPCELL